MQKWSPRLIILLGFVFIILSAVLPDPEPEDGIKTLPTGIILDSMENEVMLLYKDNTPHEFYSDIFTPVCNTGECLPVKIKIYWDLNGNYKRFAMPEGEILTKLDHVPFDDYDYDLLDEILRRENDPRTAEFKDHIAEPVKHNKDSDATDISYSEPSPGMSSKKFVFMDKHDMVDGITGSTLPEQEDKFVPGALYTSYTLWGLANDPKKLMLEFGQEHLFEKYANTILVNYDRDVRRDVIDHLTSLHPEKNGHANMLATYIDTCDQVRFPKLIPILLKQIYFRETDLDTICQAQHTAYFRTTNSDIKFALYEKWMSSAVCDYILSDIAAYLVYDRYFISPAVDMFDNKSSWPSDVAPRLIILAENLENSRVNSDKDYLLKMMLDHEDKMTPEQYARVQELADEIVPND